ncbi:MAG: homoserine kinase [Mariprofundaceae bacterium]|nr:homoserine kinase [Mariprofundaceae bacterium]
MSVYTPLDHHDISNILNEYPLGVLNTFSGISGGIENSNFFINTDTGRYVLTIFERMSVDELPYFMGLMQHLAKQGFPSPAVQKRLTGELLFVFVDAQGDIHHGCIVTCLPGQVLDALNIRQLHDAGMALARLHRAGSDFSQCRASPNDLPWLRNQVDDLRTGVQQHYGDAVWQNLSNESSKQLSLPQRNLPTGVIHGDYFRDNMLFTGDKISGVIDFYYAHDAPYALDIAIAMNALSVDTQAFDITRPAALLAGYNDIRPMHDDEWAALPDLLCLSALRFWVSRLYDAIHPREGGLTTTLDPKEYHAKLMFHQQYANLTQELRALIQKKGE